MDRTILDRHDRRVPRYTSYPTANHFSAEVGPATYERWLTELAPDARLSLYVHVPFCESLCWFCGCHTRIVRRHAPVETYLDSLLAEIELVAGRLGAGRAASHVHWGGGTPTILSPAEVGRVADALRAHLHVLPDAEFAVEIDPRRLTREVVDALAAAGVNRASLGVQDVNPEVQAAINRIQPIETTRRSLEWLRAAGIRAVNIDLMYGLPGQDLQRMRATVDAAVALEPDRLALFGYAHVPWMKRHQKLMERNTLPDRDARWAQYQVACERLADAGYVAIGIDHFARPDDPLSQALAAGRLRRNFQGYTTDAADAVIGFGASAIGSLPGGYVQNEPDLRAYAAAVAAGALPVAKGVAVSTEDHLRRALIERLMCDMEVDTDEVSARFGYGAGYFTDTLDAMADLEADGLVLRDGARLRVSEQARPLLRTVCAAFDAYLAADGKPRHAQAV